MGEFSVKVILTDIEGTTTSISFVKDILFPYAKKHTYRYLRETWEAPETKSLVKALVNQPQYLDFNTGTYSDNDNDCNNIEQISQFVNYCIDNDLKIEPLKTLQGHVWEDGYRSGKITGHVFSDVPIALKRWHDDGINVSIYSSGSIKAQKLLFGQTDGGNLLPYINQHFDTTSGHKHDKQSYVNIAQALAVDPKDILFLTDVVKEAEAARLADFQTVLLCRPGNAPLTTDDKSNFIVVNDFESINVKAK